MKKFKKYALDGQNPPTFEEWLQQTNNQLLMGNEDNLYKEYELFISQNYSDTNSNIDNSASEHSNDSSNFLPNTEKQDNTTENKLVSNNNLNFSDGFQLFNAGLDLTNFVAGKVNDIKASRQEKYDYEKAKYPKAKFSSSESGLNNIPITYKTGGISPNKAREILHDGSIHGHPITEKQRRFFGAKSKGNTKHYAIGGDIVLDDGGKKRKNKDLQDRLRKNYSYSGIVNDKGKWIDNPTYEEAIRTMIDFMKNNWDEHAPSPSNNYLPKWQHQSYDPINKPLDIAKYGGKYEVGGIDEVEGSDEDTDAELEKGEIFQQQNGDIKKVAETESTHEDGGSNQPFVFRVLEDTSDKRKDINSKLLKVSPEEALDIVGAKVKRSVTHSKLYENATTQYGKEFTKAEKHLEKAVDYLKLSKDKYVRNSIDENMKTLDAIPTDGIIFDKIFEHQENVKQKYDIMNDEDTDKYGGNKYATGGREDIPVPDWFKPWIKSNTLKGKTSPTGKTTTFDKNNPVPQWFKPWIKSNTEKGRTSPTGKITTFDKNNPNKIYEDYNYWVTQNNGNDFNSPQEFQKFIYDRVQKSSPNAINTMWKDWGQTNAGTFEDGIFGARTADLMGWRPQTTTITTPPAVTDNAPVNNGQYNSDSQINKPVQASDFNSPLEWYDVAGDTMGLLSNNRIQVPLEQLSRKDLRYREQSPLPTIQQGQEDYNSLVSTLPQNQIGFANQANLLGKKYSLNNQVFGQYENINKTGAMNVDNQNIQAEYQVDAANLGLRDQFNQRILQGKEIQQQNKLRLFNDLFTKVAQNKAFNRNGDLLMQMFPYFNQEGKFNGNKYNIVPNPSTNSYQKVVTKGGAIRYKPN